jgi:raffinose/stachyose/melibiose transport system substrate-binding protein
MQAKYPGTKVDITLLPANNDELAAKVEAAFASHSVPDLMFLYSGAYTTVYQQGLLPLNKFIDATPGFYNATTAWNLSCANLDCQGGSGTILGVPADLEAFFLYYNKKLFAQAGLAGPPTTWSQLLSDCAALKAKGIVPMTYGDLEGYTTVNFWDENLASYISQAQMNAILAGHLKLTDPPVVSALNAVAQLRTSGCAQSNASTVDQLAALNGFDGSKTAMVEMVPAVLGQLESGIGASNLGVTIIPGTGPLGTHVAANSADDWVIPAQAADPDLAWDFIKIAMDNDSAAQFVKDVAYPPTNIAAGSHFADPLLKYMAAEIALYLYKELNLFFAGQTSAQDVMSATQSQLNTTLAQSG